MERGKKEKGVLNQVAELFDLPPDLVAGLPHIEMAGGREMYVENHRGLLAYSDTAIDINTSALVLRVRGQGLELLAMTAEELRIGGQIEGLDFLR